MTDQPQPTPTPVSVFYSYAREDEVLRKELENHLSLLQRQRIITGWHDRKIVPGTDWTQELDHHLNSASVILLLISADFLASDYCYSIEMGRAMERHKAKEARVIPILLRPVDWENAPFATLQALPTAGKPVTSWSSRDDAFSDVASGIRRVVQELLMLDQARSSMTAKNYKQALEIYDKVLQLQSDSAVAYAGKGDALSHLKRYEEAVAAYGHALQLDPAISLSENERGAALLAVERYEEALVAYSQAIAYGPSLATAYSGKGDILSHLHRYEEALAAYEEALRLEPASALLYANKGRALEQLAYQSYQQAQLHGYHDKSSIRYTFSPKNVEPGSIKPEEFTLIRTLKHSHTPGSYEHYSVNAIAISPNSQFIASGGTDASIKLWNAETGQLLHTFMEFNHYTPFVTFSLDGKTLIGSGEARTIKMWNVETGQLLRSFVGYAEEFRHATMSLDGQALIGIVFKAKDGFIFEVRNIETGKCLHQWAFSPSMGSTGSDAFAISPDGKAIVSVEHNHDGRYFKLWDVQTGTCMYTFGTWSMGSALSISPDGQTFASSNGKTIQFWSLNTGQLLRVFIGHSNDIGAVAFSPDGQMLISGSNDQTIKIWGRK